MKKVLPFILIISVFLTSCAKENVEYIAYIDGIEVSKEEFLLAQLSAYTAADFIINSNGDIEKYTIEGINAVQWINNETIKNLKVNHYINQEFDNLSLTLSSEDEIAIDEKAQTQWQFYKELCELNNISYQTYYEYVTTSYKQNLILTYMLNEALEKTSLMNEEQDIVDENICKVYIFTIDSLILEKMQDLDRQEDFENILNIAIEKTNSGENFVEVIRQTVTQINEIVSFDYSYNRVDDYITDYVFLHRNDATNEFFDMPVRTAKFTVSENNEYRIIYRAPAYESEDEYDMYHQMIIHNEYFDDFEEDVLKKATQSEIDTHPKLFTVYSPIKVNIRKNAQW